MRFSPENSSGTRGVGSGVGATVIVGPSMHHLEADRPEDVGGDAHVADGRGRW